MRELSVAWLVVLSSGLGAQTTTAATAPIITRHIGTLRLIAAGRCGSAAARLAVLP
jgi:hypothetical protein